MQIIIPYIFCSLNDYIKSERGNKYAAAKIKENNTQIAVIYCKKYVKEFQKLKPPFKLKFTWHLKNKKKDLDNICFAKKFILDGLVKAGCIKSDGQNYINAFEDRIEYSQLEFVEIEILGNKEVNHG